METRPFGQTARPPANAKGQGSPCTKDRGWGGAIETCLFQGPIYYQWLRLLAWKNRQKGKILIAGSIQNKNTAQQRPLVDPRPQILHPATGPLQRLRAARHWSSRSSGGDIVCRSGTKASPGPRPVSAAEWAVSTPTSPHPASARQKGKEHGS